MVSEFGVLSSSCSVTVKGLHDIRENFREKKVFRLLNPISAMR